MKRVSTMMANAIACLALAASLASSCAGMPDGFPSGASERLAGLELRYGVEFVVSDFPPDTWSLVRCDPADEDRLIAYLDMLEGELGKYPAGFFERGGVGKIALCANLSFDGQQRDAIPDPYEGTLYYDVDSLRHRSEEEDTIMVFHHELHHYIEYALWGDMYHSWPAWVSLNPRGFKYGKGGIYAYEHGDIDWMTPFDPEDADYLPGFVTRYATLGEEEDRAELFAFAMTDSTRAWLRGRIATDPVMGGKLVLLRKTHVAFFGEDAPEWVF